MRSTKIIVALLLLVVTPAAGQDFQIESTDSTNTATPITDAYTYRCGQGGFKTRFPAGCGAVRENWSEPDEDADPRTAVELVHIFCDQHGEQGSGVSVTAIFNERNDQGEPAGPAEVRARIEEQLSNYNARVVHQMPLRRELPEGRFFEGMDVMAQDNEGPGRVWVRGLLEGSDMYILSAWNKDGGVWTEKEFQDFFNQFELLE
ncbi:MAG: hypothetical protein GY838_05480 [bacterium]|nr:hypothetical protein [bacterium]